jgi:hypothetical protein
MVTRYRDDGSTLYDFMHLILVRCPRCQHCAQVIPVNANERGLFGARKLVCSSCVLCKYCRGNIVHFGGNSDSYFRLPLWLQTHCCGKVLWAYNAEHLDFIEKYVQATMRQGQIPHMITGARNGTFASRLPKWIKSAKNCEEVLKKIALIRKTLL